MKLAVALNERADLIRRMNGYAMRANENTVRINDDEATDDPQEMLNLYHDALNKYEDLVYAINETNNRTMTSGGLNLAAAIVRRDTLKMEQRMYDSLAEQARRQQRPENFRYHTTTDKDGNVIKPTIHKLVDAKEMRRRADNAARDLREWDTIIQECNWRTELIDTTMTAEDFEDTP